MWLVISPTSMAYTQVFKDPRVYGIKPDLFEESAKMNQTFNLESITIFPDLFDNSWIDRADQIITDIKIEVFKGRFNILSNHKDYNGDDTRSILKMNNTPAEQTVSSYWMNIPNPDKMFEGPITDYEESVGTHVDGGEMKSGGA